MAETKKENWFKRTGKRIAKFLRELKSELKKVVWPTWGQVLKNALTVLLCVIIVGIFIWIFDLVATGGYGLLLNLGK
ncbi:MAG: preprotein translocase subunit SecE [Faecousia sp.]